MVPLLSPMISLFGFRKITLVRSRQIDNDGTGDGIDDFRLYIDKPMLTSTAYSINAIVSVTPLISFSDNLNLGTFTDYLNDGATTFLGGFQLQIDSTVIPEPSMISLILAVGFLVLSKRKLNWLI